VIRRIAAVAALGVLSGPATEAASSPARHHVFWEAAAGPIFSDNVYRDSSQEQDTGYDVHLHAGLRSRHSSRLSTQLGYDLDVLAFPTANIENRVDHAFDAVGRRRLGERLVLELQSGFHVSRYPHFAIFDNTDGAARLSLRSPIAKHMTIESGVDFETRSYPDYDLDYHGPGVFAGLSRDFGRTFGEVAGAFRHDAYSERRLVDAVDDGARRRDDDWHIGARVVHDLTLVVRLELQYELGRIQSNGDAVAGLPDEEQVLGDYYSHHRQEISARLRALIRRGSSITTAVRYRGRHYRARLARDAAGAIRVPEELRHDGGCFVAVAWDFPVPKLSASPSLGHLGLRLRYVFEINRSNEALYDYEGGAFSVAVTSWH
jgi:hypothetical protein